MPPYLSMGLIAKATRMRILHAEFHCNRLTTVYKIFKITLATVLGTQYKNTNFESSFVTQDD